MLKDKSVMGKLYDVQPFILDLDQKVLVVVQVPADHAQGVVADSHLHTQGPVLEVQDLAAPQVHLLVVLILSICIETWDHQQRTQEGNL